MAHYTSDQLYNGEEKVVIAIDVGTTHSAVSFSYLYPGDRPVVRMVTKWPGQPEAVGDSKIPTIVAYQNGVARAFGAEAKEFIGDDEYQIAKWFKLHLHPDSMKISNEPPDYNDNPSGSRISSGGSINPPNPESAQSAAFENLINLFRSNETNKTDDTLEALEVPPLPTNVTLMEVYTEFVKYLLQTTQKFFENSIPNGNNIWTRLERKSIDIVLTTPNGWDTPQQSFLRTAVMKTGFLKSNVPDLSAAGLSSGGNNHDNDVHDPRIDFITEGEASVHYALAHSQSASWLKKGTVFAVTDAGGSTVDSTLYKCKSLEPSLVLEEVCASECVQAGGVFVDRAARTVLQAKLRNSKYGEDEFIDLMVDEFEKKTKRIFDGDQPSNVIHFGRNNDNDRAFDIIKGKISLTQNDISSTFDKVVSRIVDSCLKLLNGRKIEYLLLVGGFGESPYLRKRLSDTFKSNNTMVVNVEEPSKKAAAEGATIWYLKRLVVARAARFTIGTQVDLRYNPNLPHHRARQDYTYIATSDGSRKVPHCFDVWVRKNEVIDQDKRLLFHYRKVYSVFPKSLDTVSKTVWAWEGQGHPEFARDVKGNPMPHMRKICTIEADLSALRDSLKVQYNNEGKKYWRIKFRVAVMFGGTQLRARLVWEENGITREGPVIIIPEQYY